MSKHNSEIADREGKMINFIDAVEKTEKKQQGLDKLKQSPQSKLKKIKECKEDAKKECVDYVLTKIYSDALPIDNTYKGSHLDDMSMEFMDYINNKEEKGLPLYVHEASKKGSEFAKILTESVDALVNDYFREASVDPSSVDYDDIGFDIDDDTAQKGLGDISDKLNIDDISEIIKENVKKTALNDIIQAKQKNNESKQIIDELKSDESLTTESAVERALRLRGLSETEYNPNLFEGIMINKVKLITESYPDMDEIDVNSFAYCESVKELTKINVLNATNLVTFKPWENAAIGKKYAQMKVPESGISLYTENADEELFEEGANLEIRAIYKASISKIKAEIKDAKSNMKSKNYDSAIKSLNSAKAELKKNSDEIEKADAGKVGSMLYKNSIKVKINEYIKVCDHLISKINEKKSGKTEPEKK